MELSESIKAFGDVIEPLVVRLRPESDLEGEWWPQSNYMLVSGHRRLAAAKLAGLETIHCIVWENLSDKQAFEMQLVENLHRADLLPIEEAEAYKRMHEELGYTYAEIALRVGKSEKHIGRYMKMVSLPEEIKDSIDKGDLTVSKAQYLCSLPNAIIDDVLKDRKHLLDSYYNAKEMEESIKRNYMDEMMDDIAFDKKKKYTDENGNVWPACIKCPHKDQMEMFDDLKKEGSCPFGPCFRAKQEIAENEKETNEEETEEKEKEREERQANFQKEQKIRKAVDKAKYKYYIDKRMETKFKLMDLIYFIEEYSITEEDKELILEYVGKDIEALKQKCTLEEVLKVFAILHVTENYYDEEVLCKWLGCEQCPDELLQAARNEAMGINKRGSSKKK